MIRRGRRRGAPIVLVAVVRHGGGISGIVEVMVVVVERRRRQRSVRGVIIGIPVQRRGRGSVSVRGGGDAAMLWRRGGERLEVVAVEGGMLVAEMKGRRREVLTLTRDLKDVVISAVVIVVIVVVVVVGKVHGTRSLYLVIIHSCKFCEQVFTCDGQTKSANPTILPR